jgi:AraC-like DNA-binding protein
MVLKVPAHHLRVVLDTAVEKGAAAGELCQTVGLDARLLDDLEARVPLEMATALYDESARRTGDGGFGLHVAERSDYFAFDALGFAISTKQNLREAFEHLAAAITALQGTRMELDVVADTAHLTFELPEEPTRPCRHRTEAYMARVVRMIELATGARPKASRVAFRHAEPDEVSEHERIFRAPLAFGAPRNELVIEQRVLDVPLVRADPRLSEVLDRHVRDLVQRMPAEQTLADQVRRYVRDAFPHGDFGLESIGRRMGLAPRTLQRQLSAEGTSYRQVLEQARQELALRYLAETRTPIKEVAVLLGYSELQAFYRAFERWTGLPPAAYRRKSS